MSALVQGATGSWEVVIGVEIHAQVISRSKLFSGAATEFGAEPNANVSLVDAAMPGMLPVINGHCVEQAVRTGLGLDARINLYSVFDRKNYFYPDLPPGYQISQYLNPIVGQGTVILDMPDGTNREIGITRLHLEQDAGKSLHDRHPTRSYVDLNRAGVALMEIVSEPDLRSAEEAGLYISKLRAILRYLGTCDGNMEEGSMRADVNVSVRRPGEGYGTRCEIKNLNSVRFVQQAIDYEARRQVDLIEDGGTVKQATRLFDSERGVTREMRSKEEAHDYRYLPDPDLLPLVLDPAWVDEIKAGLPELPDAKKARYEKNFGLTPYQASVLVADKEFAESYEKQLKNRGIRQELKDWIEYKPKTQLTGPVPSEVATVASSSANFFITDLTGWLRKTGRSITDPNVARATEVNAATLLNMRDGGVITARVAKDLLPEVIASGRDPRELVDERGLAQVSDGGEIDRIVAEVLAANPDKVAQYKGGKEKLLGFFVGQVMKATQGKANPKLVNEALARALAE